MPINWDELPIVKKEERKYLHEYAAQNTSPIFLDVGGTEKYWKWKKHFRMIEDYTRIPLNFEVKHMEHGICGDANKLPIKSNSIDIVYSRNLFEHLKEPWIVAEECVRVTKPGGLLIHRSPFSWRYHAKPFDCYRYTHEGLTHLFERTRKIEKIAAGYCNRRINQRKRRFKINDLDYWTENWISIFIGRKTK